MAAPVGMVFNITGGPGSATATTKPVAEFFADTGATGGNPPVSAEGNAEAPFPGDNQLVVTGVAQGVAPSTIATLITSNLTIPAAVAGISPRWQVTYSALNGGPTTAVAW